MGWRANSNAKHQAKFDEKMARNKRAEDDRQARLAITRGASKHKSIFDMNPHEAHAHGHHVRRSWWSGNIISDGRFEDGGLTKAQRKAAEREEERQVWKKAKKDARKQKAKAAAIKAVRGKGKGTKKRGFFYWE
jgi:hypothetical protein